MPDPLGPGEPQATEEARWRRAWSDAFWMSALLGVLPALLLGSCVLLWLSLGNSVGAGITLGIPIATGALAGFALHEVRAIVCYGLVIAGLGCLLGGMLAMDIAGVFCAAVYAVGAFPIGLLSAACARAIRCRLGRRRGARGPIAGLFLLPLVLYVAEVLVGPARQVETLTQTAFLQAPIHAAWSQTLTGTGGTGSHSAWFRLGAPQVLNASGAATRAGDVKTFRFHTRYPDGGRLSLRVDRVLEERELHLTVLEQRGLEPRAVRLHRIRVLCEPTDHRTTRATIEMDYTPLMTPRWYWRPFERYCAGLILDQVFEAWQRALDEEKVSQRPR